MAISILRDLLRQGVLGVLIVSMPVVVAALIVLAATSRAPGWRSAAVASFGAFVAWLVTALCVVCRLRGQFVDYALHDEPKPGSAFAAFASAFEIERFVAAASLFLTVLVVAIAIRKVLPTLRCPGSWSLVGALLVGALALPLVTAAVAVLVASPIASFHSSPREKWKMVVDAYEVLDCVEPWVIGGGVLAGVAVRGLALGGVLPRSQTLRAASLVLGALGLSTFAATRGMAADAKTPIPFTDSGWTAPGGDRLPPSPTPCTAVGLTWNRAGQTDPMLVVTPGGVLVNGVLAKDVGQALRTAHDESTLSGPEDREGGAHAYVAASRETPAGVVMRVVADAKAAGYRDALAVALLPQDEISTHTLGLITRTPRVCLLGIVGGDDGTWRDHVVARP